jgi:tagatose 1,6-diphosphate aldolase
MLLPISVGKFRHLQQCATQRGNFAVLALDHRGNLRQLLRPNAPGEVTAQEIVDFKHALVSSLAPAASAVLLDPEFSAAQCITNGALPGQTGLVVALEATGYAGDTTKRVSRVSPGWNVEKTKRMGASAIKLLVYYHPEAETAKAMEDLVGLVVEDCRNHAIPLFLETLSYSLDPAQKKLPPAERHSVVIETARRLTPLGADVLKAEFPVDISVETSDTVWKEACLELSQASQVPWVLLSGSADYETFLRQVTVACQAGASGVAVGRAVWRETTELTPNVRQDFLDGVARPRMQRITDLVNALARPWTEFYTTPDITPEWYKS